ncbi:uncharacterized protein LOC143239626 [Tachypleus tridentatus]|uniref:uncharacterized protein LOC143239626 n=1 Tax=Tachypleus tridentatus TaxID=6853 RepID=UPI003FD18D07
MGSVFLSQWATFFHNRWSATVPFSLCLQVHLDELGLSLDDIAVSTDKLIPPCLITIPKCDFSLSHLKKADTSDWKYRLLFAEHLSNHLSIPIYTDGSKSGDSVGSAMMQLSHTESHLQLLCLLPNCTPFLLLWIILKLCSTQIVLFIPISVALCKPWNLFISVFTLFLLIFETDWPISLYHLLLFSFSGYLATWVFMGTCLLMSQSVCSGTVTAMSVPYMDYSPVFKARLHASWQSTWSEQHHNKLFQIKLSFAVLLL